MTITYVLLMQEDVFLVVTTLIERRMNRGIKNLRLASKNLNLSKWLMLKNTFSRLPPMEWENARQPTITVYPKGAEKVSTALI